MILAARVLYFSDLLKLLDYGIAAAKGLYLPFHWIRGASSVAFLLILKWDHVDHLAHPTGLHDFTFQ